MGELIELHTAEDESLEEKQKAARERYAKRLETMQPDTIRIALLADNVNDIERLRIAIGNRLAAVENVKAGDITPGYEEAKLIHEALDKLEKDAIKVLEKAVKSHRIGPFVKETTGLGYKTIGRFIASVGEIGDRRSPAQLWAYCGLDVRGGVAPKRTRGVNCDWNTKARTRAIIMVDPIIKGKGPYRKVYEDARAKYADADISKGHQHNRAKRIVAKAVLKDLWRYLHALEKAEAV